jgi:hypothetical protein
MSPGLRRAVLWFSLVCLFIVPNPAGAQQTLTSAMVTGTVYDPTDAVVVGATISLRNHDTNQALESVSDGRGRYRLPYVPVGRYRLTVSAQGFAVSSLELTLGIGQAIEVPLTLTAGAVAESVSVSAEAPVVEAGRTQVAETITPREVDSLPLNGRNCLDLALLAPNVSRTNTRSNERFAETSAVPGTGISVAGQRNIGNTFIVDGLSANDDAADLAGTYYSEEVIREFQVITSGGRAEFGRASAGVINIVTQSGTNQVRGRAYGFFRNDLLDARNPLATQEDPLRQSQVGMTFGGPIARDRTFWFANVEHTDQNKTGIITVSAANLAAINRVLDQTAFGGPRIATGDFPTGYRTFNLFGRVDHQVSGTSRLQFRYGFYDVASDNARGVGGLNTASRGTRLDNVDNTAAASWLTSLGSRAMNEARVQWTRSRLGAPGNDLVGPAVGISGVANFGASSSSPTGRDLDVLQLADTYTVQSGSHLLKAGTDVLLNRVSILFPGALPGSYTFSNLANFERGVYTQFQQAFGDPQLDQFNPNAGLFVQDEWRPMSGVTVNAGLRYDLQWLEEPMRLDANNVSPRLGVAWAPGDQQTVIRASAGVYYDRIPLRATSNALQRDGINYKVAVLSFGQAGFTAFPVVMPSFPSNLLTAITTMDTEIQNGRSEQAGLQVERAVGRHLSATVGYSYLRGHQIIMSRNINVPTLTAAQAAALGIPNLGRPNPGYGNISNYESIGDSWFNGFTVSAGTRNTGWGSARVSYTLSKSEDTSGNAFFSSPQDANDIAAEKGPSDQDQRHRLVVSGTIGGPGAMAGTARTLERVLGGVQIGYVVSYATGVPFNIVTGNDRNNDTNANDRPIGVGRNSGRQDPVSTVDLRLSRGFSIGTQRLDVMLEAFNVLNYVNILALNNTYGTGTVPNAAFGQPTLAGDPRQMQVGVRWTF